MKQLNAKYLIWLLLLSFCSASTHAFVEHDDSVCSVCIHTSTNKNQVLVDADDVDVDYDCGILLASEAIFLGETLSIEVFTLTPIQNTFQFKHYSIRAPPITLS